MQQVHIHFKKPPPLKQKIVPVFLPFIGCKNRCIFCSQYEQTGIKHETVSYVLELLEQTLELRASKNLPAIELGFFGGTFTLLTDEQLNACLKLVEHYIEKKIVSSARCSTRPDAINEHVLNQLWKAGFKKIELGVQSFNNDALKKAERGYTDKIIYDACHMITKNKFELGIQLLPGMPGVNTKIFEQDVQKALDSGANFLRFYPCLVIKNTKLAVQWENGTYQTWNFEEVIDALSNGYIMAQKADIPVIRIGLAPELSLKQNILAGIYHDSLGSIIQANALYKLVEKELVNKLIIKAHIPRWCQGFFWGHKKDMYKKWSNLGLNTDNIKWHDHDVCTIIIKDNLINNHIAKLIRFVTYHPLKY